MIKFIKNKLLSNTGMLIRLDDIAENINWQFMDECEILFDKYNIKPLLGVIPNNEDKELLLLPKNAKFWEKVGYWQNKKWEIAMHGYSHLYEKKTNKLDFFNHGGNSEFFGQTFDVQKEKIKKGLEIFKEKGIHIRSFFAPNHTYDLNTLKALKECGIQNIIDGYGLIPYKENGLNFIPQLFYRVFMLPYGIQSTSIHLNLWSNADMKNFKNFIMNNHKKIISFDVAINKVSDKKFFKLLNLSTKIIIKFIRSIRLIFTKKENA